MAVAVVDGQMLPRSRTRARLSSMVKASGKSSEFFVYLHDDEDDDAQYHTQSQGAGQ